MIFQVIPLEAESTLKGNLVTRQDFDEIMDELKAPISQQMKKRFYEVIILFFYLTI